MDIGGSGEDTSPNPMQLPGEGATMRLSFLSIPVILAVLALGAAAFPDSANP
jgi:hypothetical protein